MFAKLIWSIELCQPRHFKNIIVKLNNWRIHLKERKNPTYCVSWSVFQSFLNAKISFLVRRLSPISCQLRDSPLRVLRPLRWKDKLSVFQQERTKTAKKMITSILAENNLKKTLEIIVWGRPWDSPCARSEEELPVDSHNPFIYSCSQANRSRKELEVFWFNLFVTTQ